MTHKRDKVLIVTGDLIFLVLLSPDKKIYKFKLEFSRYSDDERSLIRTFHGQDFFNLLRCDQKVSMCRMGNKYVSISEKKRILIS